MFGAINDMLLDMLAAIARRDYEQRRERQQQGIAKARIEGKYRGRKIDQERYNTINRLLVSGSSWSIVQRTVGCSRSTISSAIKQTSGKKTATPDAASNTKSKKTVVAILCLLIENGSKFTRGKKAVREQIDDELSAIFEARRLNNTETRLAIRYVDDADLKSQIDDMLADIHRTADLRNCVMTDLTLKDEATCRYWDGYEGGWK